MAKARGRVARGRKQIPSLASLYPCQRYARLLASRAHYLAPSFLAPTPPLIPLARLRRTRRMCGRGSRDGTYRARVNYARRPMHRHHISRRNELTRPDSRAARVMWQSRRGRSLLSISFPCQCVRLATAEFLPACRDRPHLSPDLKNGVTPERFPRGGRSPWRNAGGYCR